MKAIALFCPAVISIGIYCRRNGIELKPSLHLFGKYLLYVMTAAFCTMSVVTYILRMDGVVFEALDSFSFFTKYVLIESVIAFLLPYAEEIIGKWLHISFEITTKDAPAKKIPQENALEEEAAGETFTRS